MIKDLKHISLEEFVGNVARFFKQVSDEHKSVVVEDVNGDGMSIEQFIHAIEQLPSDPPVYDRQKWYTTQKEHWLGWLNEYHGPGAYGRQICKMRDAKFVYNHIVEPKMLLWLIEATGADTQALNALTQATTEHDSMQGKAAAIRRIVPWDTIKRSLW